MRLGRVCRGFAAWCSGVALAGALLCSTSCSDDGVASCTLNPSPTDPYWCTEVEKSQCQGECTCTATPGTAIAGDGCEVGWDAACLAPFGEFFYYNYVGNADLMDDFEELERVCLEDFDGTWQLGVDALGRNGVARGVELSPRTWDFGRRPLAVLAQIKGPE